MRQRDVIATQKAVQFLEQRHKVRLDTDRGASLLLSLVEKSLLPLVLNYQSRTNV